MSDIPVDFLVNVVAGLVTHAMTAFAAQSRGVVPKPEPATKRLLPPPSAATLKALAKVSRSLSAAITTDLRRFLASPDAESIVRQLCASRVSDVATSLADVRELFVSTATLYVPNASREDLRAVFDTVVAAVDQALAIEIAAGSLEAADVRSALRQRVVANELASIRLNLEMLNEHRPRASVEATEQFNSSLCEQIQRRHCTIVPPHFDAAVKVPITDIYVFPRLIFAPTKRRQAFDVTVREVLSGISRMVVLGNPGGGKSTLAQRIAFDIASRADERLASGRHVTPIVIVLREYGAERKQRNVSISEFIELIANEKYQVKAPTGAVEHLLTAGRFFVIFDGLDELLDSSYRREISETVESFCTRYPTVPVLVTSREVGYEQAPLDPRMFDLCRLAPFDTERVNEYARKWFALDSELTDAQRKSKADSFLRESTAVADLRSNPLMLALLCNIYRGENYIPQNRPEVYEKCAVMLFEKWDPSRGIHVELPFRAHIRPALMYVAHWIYANDPLQAGVSQRTLVNKTKEYLWPRRFEDPDEAVFAAQQFVEFCRGRAWVFTDTGSTPEGEPLYQFTHRTFLEYFAAGYLARTNDTALALHEALAPRIAAREWDVVAQLSYQIKNRDSEGAIDRLLEKLVDRVPSPVAELNRLSFAARSLEFVVPSPRVVRDVVRQAITRAVGIRAGLEATVPEDLSADTVAVIIESLLSAARENSAVVHDEIHNVLRQIILAGSDGAAAVAADLTFCLRMRFFWSTDISDLVSSTAAVEIERAVVTETIERIRHLASTSRTLAQRLVWANCLDIEEFLAFHGVNALFNSCQGLVFPQISWSGLAPGLVRRMVVNGKHLDEKEWRRVIDVGRYILGDSPPWLDGVTVDLEFSDMKVDTVPEWGPISEEMLFGAFCLLAPYAEAARHNQKWTRALERLSPVVVALAIRGRNQPDRIAAALTQMNGRLMGDRAEFVKRWMRREISFHRSDRRVMPGD
jgi:NACHT domain